METVKAVLVVRFAEPLHPWHELRGLLNATTSNPRGEIQAPPFSIDLQDKRQRVILQVRAITFEQERVKDADAALVEASGLLAKVHRASPLPPMRSVHYETVFIEPFSLPFHELLSLFKSHFIKSTGITELATDLGLVLDVHERDIVKHFQLGPMEAGQLKSDYLRWPPENVPDRFAFLSLAYEHNAPTPYDDQVLKDILRAAATWQSEQAQAIFSFLHQEGG